MTANIAGKTAKAPGLTAQMDHKTTPFVVGFTVQECTLLCAFAPTTDLSFNKSITSVNSSSEGDDNSDFIFCTVLFKAFIKKVSPQVFFPYGHIGKVEHINISDTTPQIFYRYHMKTCWKQNVLNFTLFLNQQKNSESLTQEHSSFHL